MDNEDVKMWLFTVGITLITIAFAIGYAIFDAHMEAGAYNRVTGKSVRWQDALWIELRVQESAQ